MEAKQALLLAVSTAVEKRIAKGANKWALVGEVMKHLTGETGDWRKRWQRAKAHCQGNDAHLDAVIASVEQSTYAETVEYVLQNGATPSGSPPAIPSANTKKPVPPPDPTDDEIEERAEADIRIEQAEARSRINKRLYEATKKRAAFVATAMDMLQDVVTAMPEAKWDPSIIPAIHMKRELDAVLVLSDIHIGDKIEADTMGAINVYNYDVFKEKAKRLYAGVKESVEMLTDYGKVRRLKVLGLGDWVTGTNIFPGQAHHIEFGAMKQAMHGADELAQLYFNLLELPHIEAVDAEHVPGNHGRPGRKGADPFEDNWDLVLYEFLRLRLANQPRLNFKWHQSWWMKPRIRGWDFLCAHGDEVKGWGGIPNYGLRRWAARWREMLDSIGERYDYGVIGHHHVEVEERDLIISGAWPGASFFSAKELQMGGPATQMFYGVSEDYGITWRRRLPLDPPRKVHRQQETA